MRSLEQIQRDNRIANQAGQVQSTQTIEEKLEEAYSNESN